MRGHGAKDIGQQDLLRARLDAQINMNEPLVRLGQVIRWEYLPNPHVTLQLVSSTSIFVKRHIN